MADRNAYVGFACTQRLKDKLRKVAKKENRLMSAIAERALAYYVGHPELADLPRNPKGRPRKQKSRKTVKGAK